MCCLETESTETSDLKEMLRTESELLTQSVSLTRAVNLVTESSRLRSRDKGIYQGVPISRGLGEEIGH